MSQWTQKTKVMTFVQPVAEDTVCITIPLPTDFYDLGKVWTLKYGGNAKLPRETRLYRRICIGDLVLSELTADSLSDDFVLFSDEVTVICYQDMLVDVFSKGVHNVQPVRFNTPDQFWDAQSGRGESTMSMYDSPILDRNKPIDIKFWVAPITVPAVVYLSHAVLTSVPE